MVDSNDLSKSVCQLADEAVTAERIRDYGHPKENFADIAAVWSVLLGPKLKMPISATDIPAMMIALKLCRNMAVWKRDNFVDICGFAKCADLVKHPELHAAEFTNANTHG
jgi:hypothetical protein